MSYDEIAEELLNWYYRGYAKDAYIGQRNIRMANFLIRLLTKDEVISE